MVDEEGIDVLNRLKEWHTKLRSVAALFRASDPRARPAYIAVKASLKAERAALQTNRRGEALTPAEVAWYERPIGQAAVHLTAPTNAAVEKVLSSLYEAEQDIFLVISRMEHQLSEQTACLERLVHWRDRLEALYDGRAQESYGELKAALQAEAQQLGSRPVGAPLGCEESCYRPTVMEAASHLTAAANSKPTTWRSGVYDALGDFTHMIAQFARPEDN